MFDPIKSIIKRYMPSIWSLLVWIKYPTPKVEYSLQMVNFIFQRLLRINGYVPWMVHYSSSVTCCQNITFGKEVWVSFAASGNCYIQGVNGISIGDYTIFAPGVKIISANHNPLDLEEHLPAPPIEIGRHCWIGANAVILPGVKLGDYCVVGAGAVVTRSFPPGSVLVGVPARRIRSMPVAEGQ
jgi:acetyltransferase-like isoleucine patch superfamily enzyme